ncbi:hypothetical protein [Micromonospora okii]|uniref:hypothetical protein n=1 Tax=Micromonospora okii TaxID=1182970 RepID=UPI001E653C04|nr:hypothetical protein [Micromonospora okii]
MTTIEPGIVMSAADALTRGQATFTAAQVSVLLHLAYETGRRHGAAEDLAELHGTWMEMAAPRPTREQRVADRLGDMEHRAQVNAARRDQPYRVHPGGPVDFHTGEPVQRINHLYPIGEAA